MASSEIISTILVIAAIILLAKILGELFEKIGFPSLVGEVLAGIVLGPALFSLFEPSALFLTLAEIGIILLIFLAGFEHGSISELLKYKSTSLTISAVSSTLPIAAVVALALWQGFSLLTALFLAVGLGATSMGVSLRSLMGINQVDTKVGKTVIGSLVVNDMTGLLLLTFVVGYADIVTGAGANFFVEIGMILLSVLIFFLIFFVGFKFVPKLTLHFMKLKVEEANFSLALILTFVSAAMAYYFGLSSIIGAFFAGIILSKSPVFENHSFKEKINSLSYGFFIPLFFAVTGAQLAFDNFTQNLGRALLFLALITTVQVGSAFIVTKIQGYKTGEGLLVGFGMLPYGEVTLIVMSALLALVTQFPDMFVGEDVQGLFSSILLLILASILLTPLAMKIISKLFKEVRV